jgi:hypothetical protein
MKLNASDVIAIVSAMLAVLALFVGLYAAVVTQRVATSGFQSAERVKSDTATLLAALRGLMIKAALYSQQEPKTRDDEKRADFIDIKPEKAVIQSFLDSPTAVAYYAFVAGRSKSARAAGRESEDWRIFFYRLVQLMYETNTYDAGILAGQTEKMFDNVSDSDLEMMSSGLEDLVGSIKGIALERTNDVLISAFVDKKKHEPDFKSFVAFLRKQGVKDPDVDLFWSAMSDDVNLTKDALKRGAKVNVTEGEIESRYKELWQKFKSQSLKGPRGTPVN